MTLYKSRTIPTPQNINSRYVTLPWQQHFWMTTNWKSHLKIYSHYFKPHQSYSISFNLANLGENFLWDRSHRYLSLEKESDNFCVVFTDSIKRAREIRKFHDHVVVLHQKCTKQLDARAKLLFVNINILFFAVLLAVAVVVGFVVIKKQCYHGNVTSHFSPLYLTKNGFRNTSFWPDEKTMLGFIVIVRITLVYRLVVPQ